MPSFVWNHFRKCGNATARCTVSQNEKICGKILKCNGSSTKGLKDHLKLHGIYDTANANQENQTDAFNAPTTSSENNLPPAKRQRTIEQCFHQKSFEEAVAREVAGGFNYVQIVNSDAIRSHFITTYPTKQFPVDGETLAKIVREYYEKTAKPETTKKIQQHLKSGKFFSTTIDEWTSNANRRYLNVSIHFIENKEPRKINLGLKRIVGKADADKIKQLVGKIKFKFPFYFSYLNLFIFTIY
jgi:hypothetical protein